MKYVRICRVYLRLSEW